MPNRKNNAGLLFIFITVVLDSIGLGIIIPVMPALIKELIHGDLSQASAYGGWLTFCYAFTQFFSPQLDSPLSTFYMGIL